MNSESVGVRLWQRAGTNPNRRKRPRGSYARGVRSVRQLLRPVSLLATALSPRSRGGTTILMYHRVSGDVNLELDLPREDFRAQMASLAETKCVVSLDEAIDGFASGWEDDSQRFVITFDDAYEDFYSVAWPVLEKFGLPATLYVPTGFIDAPDSPPITARGVGEERLRPVTWSMLEQIARSSLITIGGHTHTHRELPTLGDQEIVEELEQCDGLLEERLGVKVEHFAYPRGAWDRRVRGIVVSRYRSVARADGGVANAADFDPLHLPRIPVQRSDGMRWFPHRAAGRLTFEDWAISSARRAMHRIRRFRSRLA